MDGRPVGNYGTELKLQFWQEGSGPVVLLGPLVCKTGTEEQVVQSSGLGSAASGGEPQLHVAERA